MKEDKNVLIFYSFIHLFIFLFIFLLIVLCALDVISRKGMHIMWLLGSFVTYHSDQSFPLTSLFLRSFRVLYILWHIKWLVDVTLIENVQPSKFHNRQNKVRVKRRSSLLPLFCCQTITTTRRIFTKMRTPVTAFQMTSLHWQRSISVNRTMNEKLKLNQLVYIGAEGHCLCCFKYQQHSIIHLLSFKTIKNAF